MTVKEVLAVFTNLKEVRLAYDALSTRFDHTDALMVDAFSKYLVDHVYAIGEDKIEIYLVTRPVAVG